MALQVYLRTGHTGRCVHREAIPSVVDDGQVDIGTSGSVTHLPGRARRGRIYGHARLAELRYGIADCAAASQYSAGETSLVMYPCADRRCRCNSDIRVVGLLIIPHAERQFLLGTARRERVEFLGGIAFYQRDTRPFEG